MSVGALSPAHDGGDPWILVCHRDFRVLQQRIDGGVLEAQALWSAHCMTGAQPHRFSSSAAVFAILGLVLGPGCIGKDDSRPATWSYLSAAITEPNCATASCHSRAAAESGLDFSSPDRGFTSLTGLWIWIVDPSGTPGQGCRLIGDTTVCQRQYRSLVVPFDPAQSRLVQMLRAQDAPQMPPDRALPEVDIHLVESWILNGAIDDRASDGGR
jgi:hypothetical protein